MIRAWRNHFIASLPSMDPNFPMTSWEDELLAQTDLTYNLLHPWKPNPDISAYDGFHGCAYDFNAHPIAPIGTKVVIFDSPAQRATYGSHGVDGWYTGPAPNHVTTAATQSSPPRRGELESPILSPGTRLPCTCPAPAPLTSSMLCLERPHGRCHCILCTSHEIRRRYPSVTR
jgi:hypothetical protein